MARPRSGQLRERRRSDGTVKYTARIRMDGERHTVALGDERNGMTRLMAERQLAKVVEDMRLGCWQPDAATNKGAAGSPASEPPFSEIAGRFLAYKRSGQLRDRTLSYLKWALEVHLVPYFRNKRPSRITQDDVTAYTDHEIAQRERIDSLRSRGKYLAGPNGGALRAMSNRSINDTLQVLSELLAWAASKGWGKDENPAATWRLREKPRLTCALEPDELADLIAAVATPRPTRQRSAAIAARAELIVRLRAESQLTWRQIAETAGIAETTAIYHYKQAQDPRPFPLDERRAIADEALVATLARSGPRVAEVCELNVDDVDLPHQKFRVEDSKTPGGVREVDMTPGLVPIVAAYFESRGRLSGSDPAFPDGEGKRRSKDQVNKQVLAPAVRLANELRVERGSGKLPGVTAHVLRHTYITLAFEAGYSVPYVMQQVGHRDPRTTMRIYAKVCARRDRSIQGAAFDRLLADAVISTPRAVEIGASSVSRAMSAAA
jgi:integrase